MEKPVLRAIVPLALCGFAHAQEGDTFRNVALGFEVTKPAQWHFSAAEAGSDEDAHAEMLKYATAPLVAITRHPEPFDDLNPSFKVNLRPLGELKGTSAIGILKLITPQFEQMFDDFAVAERPRKVTVSGLPAGYMRVSYSLQVPDGRRFPTSSEVWIVPRGDHFFMIGAGTRQDEKTGTRSEIHSILQSVRIAERAR
jgi:hypothetical protein